MKSAETHGHRPAVHQRNKTLPHFICGSFCKGHNQYAKDKEKKVGFVMWPIRVALSGKQMTPGGATELMEVLGKEESLARIQTAIDRLSQEA